MSKRWSRFAVFGKTALRVVHASCSGSFLRMFWLLEINIFRQYLGLYDIKLITTACWRYSSDNSTNLLMATYITKSNFAMVYARLYGFYINNYASIQFMQENYRLCRFRALVHSSMSGKSGICWHGRDANTRGWCDTFEHWTFWTSDAWRFRRSHTPLALCIHIHRPSGCNILDYHLTWSAMIQCTSPRINLIKLLRLGVSWRFTI